MSETKEYREPPTQVESSAFEEISTRYNDNTAIESEKGPNEVANEVAEDTQLEIVYPTGLVLAAIVIALCLAVFLVALDQTIIATAIPRITDRFQSVKDIGWYGAVRP